MCWIKCKTKLKYFFLSCAFLIVYFVGIINLSRVKGIPWRIVPAFWVEIIYSSPWIKFISAITIFAGTMLIYFIPGVFIAKCFSREYTDTVEIYASGFLINYFLYYFASTLYKLVYHQALSREVLVTLIAISILITGVFFFFTHNKTTRKNSKYKLPLSNNAQFTIFYVISLIIIFLICWKKVFITIFNGDGVEQFWLAHSVKSKILPTSYREFFSLVPQFPLAPSIYLNMFALVLFGEAEFIIRLQVLVAFVCLGFIIKGLIEEITANKKLTLFEYLPLFLYLMIFFIVISYRAGYDEPTDLAKSSETLQLAFFLSGFYLLIHSNGKKDVLSAVLFILAAMIRYNGLIMIAFFLSLFSILLKRYKCFLVFLLGLVFMALLLVMLLNCSPYTFRDVVEAIIYEKDFYPGLNLKYFLSYLKNYFVFTAGLSIFYFLGLKNKYILLMLLTSLFYLLLPFRVGYVPAHFFVPVFIFPLLSYYLYIYESKL